MINTVALQGRITNEPELKHTQNNVPVCSFTIANDTGFGDNKKTNWIDCVAWRSTAEFICKYFTKGQEIALHGALQTRTWEDNQGNKRKTTEVVVSEVSFCGSKTQQGGSTSQPTNHTPGHQSQASAPLQSTKTANSDADEFEELTFDEDLPF